MDRTIEELVRTEEFKPLARVRLLELLGIFGLQLDYQY